MYLGSHGSLSFQLLLQLLDAALKEKDKTSLPMILTADFLKVVVELFYLTMIVVDYNQYQTVED